MPEREQFKFIAKVMLASEQHKKRREVRNAMLVLHFKQLQKKKNSTKEQKCFSVFKDTNKAEGTGKVTVQPASP